MSERRDNPQPGLCKQADCDRPVYRKDMCSMHLHRARKGLPMEAPPGLKSGPSPAPKCWVAGCERRGQCRGLCPMHRKRLASGIPLDAPYRVPKWTLDNSFTVTPNGCWEWLGPINNRGYGAASKAAHALAHRWFYAELVGPIPQGLELDHLCHTNDLTCIGGVTCSHRRCVNPNHLEAVTAVTNVRRAFPATKTHCKHGHEYTAESTYIRRNGGRSCRTCHRLRQAARVRRLRDVAA